MKLDILLNSPNSFLNLSYATGFSFEAGGESFVRSFAIPRPVL